MQIMVLGMRSGSSVITRLINLLGASVGPTEQLMKPSVQNPKGFWENEEVVRLNNRLLKMQGCAWNSIGSLNEQCLTSEAFPDLADEARVILRDFDRQRPWVIKDPRVSLLLPFWRPLLDQPLFVIIFRHPLEVAHSLKTHHDIPLLAGLALWEQYMRLSLRHSIGAPRLLVSYNAIMREPVGEVGRLCQWMQESGASSLQMPDSGEIDAFIDPALYREKVDEQEEQELLSADQQQLFAALLDTSALQWREVPKLSRAGEDLLGTLDELLLRRWNEKVLRQRLATASETIAALEVKLNSTAVND